jgi:hypothetical protein
MSGAGRWTALQTKTSGPLSQIASSECSLNSRNSSDSLNSSHGPE